jgi:hypothetical protein
MGVEDVKDLMAYLRTCFAEAQPPSLETRRHFTGNKKVILDVDGLHVRS